MFFRRTVEPENLPTDLLETAWSQCEAAQRFYADTRIFEYYTQGRRLEIIRLSGNLLPMGQCYINLAVVEHTGERSTKHLEYGKKTASAFRIFTLCPLES